MIKVLSLEPWAEQATNVATLSGSSSTLFRALMSHFNRRDRLEPHSCFPMMGYVEEIILGDTVISMNPFQL